MNASFNEREYIKNEEDEALREGGLYGRLLDICCAIVCFFDLPAVRWLVRAVTGIAVTVATYFVARGLLGGTVGWIGAIVAGAATVVVGCVGLKDD